MIRFYDYNDDFYDECFSVKLSLLKKLPRRHTLSFQRRYEVIRCRIDVETTSCVYSLLFRNHKLGFSAQQTMYLQAAICLGGYFNINTKREDLQSLRCKASK